MLTLGSLDAQVLLALGRVGLQSGLLGGRPKDYNLLVGLARGTLLTRRVIVGHHPLELSLILWLLGLETRIKIFHALGNVELGLGLLKLLLKHELVGQLLIYPGCHEGRTTDTWRVLTLRPVVNYLLVLLD